MKKLLRLITLLLVSSLILSSCGKGVYITKRKYTKGYYVNHSPKKDKKTTASSSVSARQQASETSKFTLKTTDQKSGKTRPEQTSVTADASVPIAKAPLQKPAIQPGKKNIATIFNTAGQMKLLESLIPDLSLTRELSRRSNHDVHEALSLVWIIILVILLVYLVAFLFDTFGLGWVIHILALIALILLIFWLLRVI